MVSPTMSDRLTLFLYGAAWFLLGYGVALMVRA